jgi:hypothetical protein
VRARVEAQEEAGLCELDAIMQAMEADKDPEVPAGPIQPKSKSTPETSEESSNDFWEFDKGKGAPGVKSISNPESDCLLLLEMIALLVQKKFRQKGSLSGNVGVKLLFIQMIGGPTRTKESRPKVG